MAITSPVIRTTGVADLARSAAFYRDILGFDIQQNGGKAEAVSGPARIEFGTHDYAPLDQDHPLRPSSASIFFETSDIENVNRSRAAAATRAR